ncbi:hypothetical protein NX059_012268 [Plenodomus lindquistii]|nr:hypothetical protein NX059_012268 [Plenodomus lindquistii]
MAASAKKRSLRQLKSAQVDDSDLVEEKFVMEVAQAARRRQSLRVTDRRRDPLRNHYSTVPGCPFTEWSRNESFHGLCPSASDSRLKSSHNSATPLILKRWREDTDTRTDDPNTLSGQQKAYLKPKAKVWLRQGLFVGHNHDFDSRLSESQNRADKNPKKANNNRALPLPILTSDSLLTKDPRHVFRDFKLPFDVYSPLPRKVKGNGWVKLNKSEWFVCHLIYHTERLQIDSLAMLEGSGSPSSRNPPSAIVVLKIRCGEACHNRIMAYECDSTNCRLPAEQYDNRPFAELKRRAKGNRYDYGVEVVDTQDRGLGVRAMRTFEPHQVIVEYAGEITTQSEYERRMKQVYKKDKCYYLMSFDNKMIIDATRGTIAAS